jgi:hypothetical protein
MATTTNYGWTTPDDTSLVKDGASAIRTLGSSIDSSLSKAIVQVVQTYSTTTFSTTSTSYVDVTDLTATITPQDNSNKILVIVNLAMGGTTGAAQGLAKLLRGATDIAGGTGTHFAFLEKGITGTTNAIFQFATTFLDSPATTSATTYKVQIRTDNASFSSTVNRNAANTVAVPSSITLLEVKA